MNRVCLRPHTEHSLAILWLSKVCGVQAERRWSAIGVLVVTMDPQLSRCMPDVGYAVVHVPVTDL